ncbi:MAG: sugar transferase, partial [Pseudomonadales bacterium]|nr:sugar transferase [Pseudomonadales bacterium]
MRIAKTTHLKRLLQTQDVFLSLFAYLFTVNFAWYLNILSRSAALEHIQLGIVILFLSLAASLSHSPKLHGHNQLASLKFSARFTGIVITGILLLVYFGNLETFSRTVVIFYSSLLSVGLFLDRLFLQWWYFNGRTEHNENYVKVLVIGSGKRAKKLISIYRQYSDWGLDIIGMLDPNADAKSENTSQTNDVPLLGDLSQISEVLSNEIVDEVIVCLPRSLIHNLQSIVDACEEQAVCIKFMADLYEMQTDKISLDHMGPLPILSFEPVSHDENMLIVKRLIDITIGILATFTILPVFALVAIAIKLDSRGPVFFLQKRVGLNKRNFNMIKFRSMREDAEQ